jgi:hypothetical protein
MGLAIHRKAQSKSLPKPVEGTCGLLVVPMLSLKQQPEKIQIGEPVNTQKNFLQIQPKNRMSSPKTT